jgi:hypothetical protein
METVDDPLGPRCFTTKRHYPRNVRQRSESFDYGKHFLEASNEADGCRG